MIQQLGGGRIQPVGILDHDDDRLLGQPAGELGDGPMGPVAPIAGIQLVDRRRVGYLGPDHLGEERKPRLQIGSEVAHPCLQQDTNPLRVLPLVHFHRGPEETAGGPIRQGLSTLLTSDHDDHRVGLAKRLAHQPRLADPGRTHDLNDPAIARLEPSEMLNEHRLLFRAPDESAFTDRAVGGQRSTDDHRNDLAVQPGERDRLPLADRISGEGAVDRTMRREDLPGRRARREPGGQVDGRPRRRVRTTGGTAEAARQHRARRDPKAQSQRRIFSKGELRHLNHALLAVGGLEGNADGKEEGPSSLSDVTRQDRDTELDTSRLHRLGHRHQLFDGSSRVASKRTVDPREPREPDRGLVDRRIGVDHLEDRRRQEVRGGPRPRLALGCDAAVIDARGSGGAGGRQAGELDGATHGGSRGDQVARARSGRDQMNQTRGHAGRHGERNTGESFVHCVGSIDCPPVASVAGEQCTQRPSTKRHHVSVVRLGAIDEFGQYRVHGGVVTRFDVRGETVEIAEHH